MIFISKAGLMLWLIGLHDRNPSGTAFHKTGVMT
jgi:hypothetical protein